MTFFGKAGAESLSTLAKNFPEKLGLPHYSPQEKNSPHYGMKRASWSGGVKLSAMVLVEVRLCWWPNNPWNNESWHFSDHTEGRDSLQFSREQLLSTTKIGFLDAQFKKPSRITYARCQVFFVQAARWWVHNDNFAATTDSCWALWKYRPHRAATQGPTLSRLFSIWYLIWCNTFLTFGIGGLGSFAWELHFTRYCNRSICQFLPLIQCQLRNSAI